MTPRQSTASALDKLSEKLDNVVALVQKNVEQTDEEMGTLAEQVGDLAEEVRILRIAIDDIRCELEWTMRNHAPRRAPPIGLPVTSMSKVGRAVPKVESGEPPDATPTAEPGRLFG